jgi:hypothetical protein
MDTTKMTAEELFSAVKGMGMYELEGDSDGQGLLFIEITTLDPTIRDKYLGSIDSKGRFHQNDSPDAPCLDMVDIKFISFLDTVLFPTTGDNSKFHQLYKLIPQFEEPEVRDAVADYLHDERMKSLIENGRNRLERLERDEMSERLHERDDEKTYDI